ncbi:hypothetical protein D3C76_1695120 [compost metagenome]
MTKMLRIICNAQIRCVHTVKHRQSAYFDLNAESSRKPRKLPLLRGYEHTFKDRTDLSHKMKQQLLGACNAASITHM